VWQGRRGDPSPYADSGGTNGRVIDKTAHSERDSAYQTEAFATDSVHAVLLNQNICRLRILRQGSTTGSVKQMVEITDRINIANGQTCTFGYHDLVCINSANCERA